jgi:hypothetical protein
VARKYYGTFTSVANVNYKVEIWDAPSGSGVGGTELRLVNEGIKIDRQGQGDTLFENIVKKSKASAFFAIDNNTDATYFENMATDGEGTHAMIIYKNNNVIWIGRVLSDLFQWQRSAVQANRIYEITSVDTLSLLDNYKIQNSWFTSDKITLLHLITLILKVTELDAYWGAISRSSYFVADALFTYENSSGSNYRLPRFRINATSLIEKYDPRYTTILISDDDNENNISCLEALEKILGNFAAYIILENGMFFIHQYAAYTNSIIYDVYSTTESLTATNEVITHEHTISNSARPFLEAFPTHSYQPAIKKIKLSRSKSVSKKVTKGFRTLNTNHLSIGPVTMTEDNEVKFNYNVDFIPDYINKIYFFKYRAWAVKRSNGSNYTWQITNVGGTPTGSWQLTPTVDYTTLKIDLPFGKSGGKNPYSHRFSLQYSIPDNSEISEFDFYSEIYLVSVSFKAGVPRPEADESFSGTIAITQDAIDNLTIYNNINNTKASKVLELDSNYYDGFGSDAVGNIQVYDGTNWSNADSWIAPGSATGSFENIYVKQILGFYSKAVKSVKTNVRDNGGYNGLKTLVFDSSIWVSNGYTYNAMSETYDGEWLKLYGDYTAVDAGEDEYYNDPSNQSEFRIQQLEESVDAISGVQTNNSLNLSLELFVQDVPTTPTINTRYNVNVDYNSTEEIALFKLSELGSLITLTSGTHTASVLTPSMLCNTTDGIVTINLPAAPTSKGVEFWFKKTATAHKVIVNGTIDAAGHLDINNLHESIVLVSDGTVYWIKSNYP